MTKAIDFKDDIRMRSKNERISYQISHQMRQLLIEHIDQARPIVRGCLTTKSLFGRGLLKYNHEKYGSVSRPKSTSLTEHGRAVLCVVLGQYADSLSAARQFMEDYLVSPSLVGIEDNIRLAKRVLETQS